MKTDKQKLQFCFLGNCQTLVIGWALKMMNPDIRMFWVAPLEIFDVPAWSCNYLPKSFMLKKDTGKKFLSECDVLLYNHIRPDKEGLKSWCTPENTKPSCKKISITSMFYRRKHSHEDLQNMVKKEDENNVDIRVSKSFYEVQNIKKLDIYDAQHHDSIVYKKIIPLVAEKLELDFDPWLLQFLCEGGFPYNKPWKRSPDQGLRIE